MVTKGKVYLIALCGGADRASAALDGATPFEAAVKPAIDQLAKRGRQGLLRIIDDTICPESDSGAMALLSYDPLQYYAGRGPLEGLGCGFARPNESSVAFRINFGHFDETSETLDRRTARDLVDDELQALAEELRQKVELDCFRTSEGQAAIEFKLMAYGRHRGILSFSSRTLPLSGNVSNTDPGFAKHGPFSLPVKNYGNIPERCLPLDDGPGAAIAACAVNEFVEKSRAVLSRSQVNADRISRGRSAANIILFRDGGQTPPPMPSFFSKFGRSVSILGQIPAENAIAQLIDGSFLSCRQREDEADADYFANLLDTALNDPADVLYIHVKNTDEPGHDGDAAAKISAIESIDRHFIGPLSAALQQDDIVIVTSDHATPLELMIHSADPVPVIVCGAGIDADQEECFSERHARSGALGVMHAHELLPTVLGQAN